MTRLPVILAIALLGAACSKGDSSTNSPGGGAGGGPPAMLVEVATAWTDTVVDAIAATGEIEAVQSIALRPEVDGRIVGILFREGDEVAAGTPLFKVDDAELKAQVARAEAERDLAAQALTRTRQLMADQASSQADLEQAEATARSTQASLDLLQLRLARTTVRAPFAGATGQRMVSLGDYVTSSTELVSLQTVNPERAAFQVPERYAERLRRGQQVAFRVAALPGQEFIGVVDFVDPVVRLPGRTITVKALVPNPKRTLQAGMYLDLRLSAEVRPNAVVVPEESILPLQGANFVYVVRDGKAARRQVGIGIRAPGIAEIRSGLDAGDTVVVGGQERLQDGMAVTAKPVAQVVPPAAGEGS
ncbi:MAG TPA: efflux RND transporter periplasmic adaptor subunit [Gemmatimonadales bacterium]|nr:efflux RND transporter periplasmic adaptor subunit [Gemmatimonadales bacterium]